MAKDTNKDERKFCNVALLPEDHEVLRKMSKHEQRTMTRQLSVIIRKEFALARFTQLRETDTV